jgi:hypothetical protein
VLMRNLPLRLSSSYVGMKILHKICLAEIHFDPIYGAF